MATCRRGVRRRPRLGVAEVHLQVSAVEALAAEDHHLAGRRPGPRSRRNPQPRRTRDRPGLDGREQRLLAPRGRRRRPHFSTHVLAADEEAHARAARHDAHGALECRRPPDRTCPGVAVPRGENDTMFESAEADGVGASRVPRLRRNGGHAGIDADAHAGGAGLSGDRAGDPAVDARVSMSRGQHAVVVAVDVRC